VPEAHAAPGVEPPQCPEAEQPIQVDRVAPGALDPTKDRRGTVPTVGPLAVREVRLVVVVVEEAVVDGLQLRPRRRPRVVVIGHAAHDVEVRFEVILPGLPRVDLLLPDPERRVDGPCLLRFEDAAAVADEDLRRPVDLDRRPQHDQVGGQVLARRDRTGEECPAEVLQDRDRVDRLAGAEPVVLDVAHVD
jgi:hypothetical protein